MIEELGFSVVTAPGHGATFRLMPEDSPVDDMAWGMEGWVDVWRRRGAGISA